MRRDSPVLDCRAAPSWPAIAPPKRCPAPPGVTGARAELRQGLAAEVATLRDVIELPIAVGSGISTPDQARAVAEVADGVVVGLALVARLGEGGVEAARSFVEELRRGVDSDRTGKA